MSCFFWFRQLQVFNFFLFSLKFVGPKIIQLMALYFGENRVTIPFHPRNVQKLVVFLEQFPMPWEKLQTIVLFIEPFSVRHKRSQTNTIKCTIWGAIGLPELLWCYKFMKTIPSIISCWIYHDYKTRFCSLWWSSDPISFWYMKIQPQSWEGNLWNKLTQKVYI